MNKMKMKINLSKLKIYDISMIKMSVLSAAFCLVSLWSGLANWVVNTHWAWFFVVALVLSAKPLYTIF